LTLKGNFLFCFGFLYIIFWTFSNDESRWSIEESDTINLLGSFIPSSWVQEIALAADLQCWKCEVSFLFFFFLSFFLFSIFLSSFFKKETYVCVVNLHFAVILAIIIQKLRLENERGAEPKPRYRISLVPRNPINLLFYSREQSD
jgi:hypothetical protein